MKKTELKKITLGTFGLFVLLTLHLSDAKKNPESFENQSNVRQSRIQQLDFHHGNFGQRIVAPRKKRHRHQRRQQQLPQRRVGSASSEAANPAFSDIFGLSSPKSNQKQNSYNTKRFRPSKALEQSPLVGYKPTSLSSLIWNSKQFSPNLARVDESLAFSSEAESDDENSNAGNILNVRDPKSPYALIQEMFPAKKRRPASNPKDLPKDLPKDDIWLSDGDLLILKGGTSSNKKGFDNPWPPLDNYQAPYRKPVLAPAYAKNRLPGFGRYAVVVPPPPGQRYQGISGFARPAPGKNGHVIANDIVPYSKFASHSQKTAKGVAFPGDGWVPSKGYSKKQASNTRLANARHLWRNKPVASQPLFGQFVSDNAILSSSPNQAFLEKTRQNRRANFMNSFLSKDSIKVDQNKPASQKKHITSTTVSYVPYQKTNTNYLSSKNVANAILQHNEVYSQSLKNIQNSKLAGNFNNPKSSIYFLPSSVDNTDGASQATKLAKTHRQIYHGNFEYVPHISTSDWSPKISQDQFHPITRPDRRSDRTLAPPAFYL